MFRCLTERRRRHLLNTPFPDAVGGAALAQRQRVPRRQFYWLDLAARRAR
jgi:hypothetical protein